MLANDGRLLGSPLLGVLRMRISRAVCVGLLTVLATASWPSCSDGSQPAATAQLPRPPAPVSVTSSSRVSRAHADHRARTDQHADTHGHTSTITHPDRDAGTHRYTNTHTHAGEHADTHIHPNTITGSIGHQYAVRNRNPVTHTSCDFPQPPQRLVRPHSRTSQTVLG